MHTTGCYGTAKYAPFNWLLFQIITPAWSTLLIARMFICCHQHQKSLCVLGCVHSMSSSSECIDRFWQCFAPSFESSSAITHTHTHTLVHPTQVESLAVGFWDKATTLTCEDNSEVLSGKWKSNLNLVLLEITTSTLKLRPHKRVELRKCRI